MQAALPAAWCLLSYTCTLMPTRTLLFLYHLPDDFSHLWEDCAALPIEQSASSTQCALDYKMFLCLEDSAQ